jgi:hypothetical protein
MILASTDWFLENSFPIMALGMLVVFLSCRLAGWQQQHVCDQHICCGHYQRDKALASAGELSSSRFIHSFIHYKDSSTRQSSYAAMSIMMMMVKAQ